MTDSALDIATEAARGELSAIHGPVLRTAMGDVLDALAEAGYSVDLLSELVAAEERTYQHGKRMGSREQRARILAIVDEMIEQRRQRLEPVTAMPQIDVLRELQARIDWENQR